MKSAKEFYEVYDIPHPQRLLHREELLFELLTKSEQNYLTHIKTQDATIEQLKQDKKKKARNQIYKYAGLFGAVTGTVVLFGLVANNIEKQMLRNEVQTVIREKELLQSQTKKKKGELNKQIELLTKENEKLKAADTALLEKENARLKEKNAKLNSEIIRLNKDCLGKVCLR